MGQTHGWEGQSHCEGKVEAREATLVDERLGTMRGWCNRHGRGLLETVDGGRGASEVWMLRDMGGLGVEGEGRRVVRGSRGCR